MLYTKLKSYQWYFERIGGFDQVRIQSDEDWQSLAQLDSKLWAVLSCPAKQLSIAPQTIAALDVNGDGRIRVQELAQAVSWFCERIAHPSILSARQAILPLDIFRQDTEEAARLHDLALTIQQTTKLSDQEIGQQITLAQVEAVMARFSQEAFNGDGVITRESLSDDVTLIAAFEDVLHCVGSCEDISGQPGINADLLAIMETAVQDRLAWLAEVDAAQALPLGDRTVLAIEAIDAVYTKINDYFARCALVGFDAQAELALNPAMAVYEAMYAQQLDASVDALASLPLAHVSGALFLPLTQGINPSWQVAMDRFYQYAVLPLLGHMEELSLADWQRLQDKLQIARTWLDKAEGVAVASLSKERLLAWQQHDWAANLARLIEKDKEKATQLSELSSLVTLLLYARDLDGVVHNMVTLRDFYAPERQGAFEAGHLLIDGRSMRLSMRVDDIEQHATMAQRSGMFLLYCDCARHDDPEIMHVVTAVTQGSADRLMVGRHGVFYDRLGNEWDAVVVKIVENPISITEAFWTPYKRFARLVGQQIDKFAAAKEKEVADHSQALVEKTTDTAAVDHKVAPFDIAKFAGIFAAMGLALGAIGTAIATIFSGFLALPAWQLPLVLIGVMLLISGPSMLVAWTKLRKRHVAPALDANGWALNTQAMISIPFGSTLTAVASLPAGARRSLRDPYAPKSRWQLWLWLILIAVMMLVMWQWSSLQSLAVTPSTVSHESVEATQ